MRLERTGTFPQQSCGAPAISEDNKRIITMTWAGEGLSPCFIEILVLWVTVLVANVNSMAIFVERAF